MNSNNPLWLVLFLLLALTSLGLYVFFNAAAASSILMQSAGPSLTLVDILCPIYSLHSSPVPNMTYNVFGGTLNPAQSNLFIHQLFHVFLPWIFNPFLVYEGVSRSIKIESWLSYYECGCSYTIEWPLPLFCFYVHMTQSFPSHLCRRLFWMFIYTFHHININM